MTLALDLTKKFELNLQKAGITNIPVLETRLAVDQSGSMSEEFECGWVEKAIGLFTAAAMKFDDNKSLELGFFNTKFTQAPEANEGDIGQYLATKGKKIYAHSGTNYAPILENLDSRLGSAPPSGGFFSKMFSTKPAAGVRTAANRGYVGIITDGDPNDKSEFETAVASTNGDTFYQFIAIGDQIDAKYLARIAEKHKHMSFMHVRDPFKTTDDNFYEQICNQKFVEWTKSA